MSTVRFLALAGALFGVLMLSLDLAVGMPLPWTVGEGPFIVLLSGIFLGLARRVKAERKSTVETKTVSAPGNFK